MGCSLCGGVSNIFYIWGHHTEKRLALLSGSVACGHGTHGESGGAGAWASSVFAMLRRDKYYAAWESSAADVLQRGRLPGYLPLAAEWTRKAHIRIWSYCLMPNHVHLIAVPESSEGLCRGIGAAHVAGRGDALAEGGWLTERTAGWGCTWRQYLRRREEEDLGAALRHERTGRPLGDKSFVEKLSRLLARDLLPGKRGRPRKGGN
jgi:hypothetical protein